MRQLVLGAVFAALIPLSAYAQEAGDVAAGEKAFAPCKACHNFQKNGVGPDLKGVVGRKAGTYEGYNYSAALKNSGITWDEANLHEWLKNPKSPFEAVIDELSRTATDLTVREANSMATHEARQVNADSITSTTLPLVSSTAT